MPVQHPRARSALHGVDTALFVFAGLAAGWLAYLVLADSLQWDWRLGLLVVFWLLVAYLVLPRLHRALTYLYLPDYFIGRARTSDGLLGDPVNLALLGSEAQVHAAMTAAGWTLADDVALRSSLRIIRTTLSRRSYPTAPVSPLHLFDRHQDFAYQQEVAGNPSQRHHVRFWRCPAGWRLPGGACVDWLAAGSYDRSVGLSLMTFQVTHKIAREIDVERDHIVTTISDANPAAHVGGIRHFATGYHARNGGGDQMVTDGHLPVVDLRPLPAGDAPRRVADRQGGPPAATTFSAAVMWLRGLASAALALGLLVDPAALTAFTDAEGGQVSAGVVAGLAVVALTDLGLGVALHRGRNWVRLLVMLTSAVAIVVVLVATTDGTPRPTLGSGLPHLALSVLVLLAVTSPRARAYAERRDGPLAPG